MRCARASDRKTARVDDAKPSSSALRSRRPGRLNDPRRFRNDSWVNEDRPLLGTERLLVLAADRVGEPARDRVLLVLGQAADVHARGVDRARAEEALADRVLDLDDH